MGGNMRFWLITPLAFLSLGFSSQAIWQFHPISGHLTGIERLAVHPRKAHLLFFTSSGGLYKADLQTLQITLLFTFPSGASYARDLIVADRVYAATDAGVYAVSENGGGQLILQASEGEAPIRALAAVNGLVFVGSHRGVKFCKEGASSWTVLREAQNHPVTCLKAQGAFLYIGADDKVIRYDTQNKTFKDILVAPANHLDAEAAEMDLRGISYDGPAKNVFLGFDIDGPHVIFAINAAGVWTSVDNGEHWESPASGTAPRQINAVRVIEEDGQAHMMAATDQGVFVLMDGRWQALREGMETLRVNDVIQMADGRIFAATDRGIFVLSESRPGPTAEMTAQADHLSPEPGVREVQEMAVEYAEVHPSKISRWRKQARRRAIMPDVSLGLDRDASELLHWDTGPNPDQLSRGKELVNWDMSLSWDLGDLIWNPDQTSIDSRSKLMVELRDEIINQVTRIYFERRHLQLELARQEDPVARVEMDLRIQELTALLDGLTGGRFSGGMVAGK